MLALLLGVLFDIFVVVFLLVGILIESDAYEGRGEAGRMDDLGEGGRGEG